MAECSFARACDRDEIVAFIDYVFSKAHRPHDFETLLPKLYGAQGDGAAHHVLIRENGRLAATILVYPVPMHIGGERLVTLGVGSVSTHPMMRGRGYMDALLGAVDRAAQETGAAFAVLGGQRQRYQYYGFDNGGYQLRAQLDPANVRHALRNVDASAWDEIPMAQAHAPQAKALMERQACYAERPEAAYLEILRSWSNAPFTLTKAGKPAGFGALRKNPDGCHIAELLLEDEADFPAAMKRLSERHGALTICAAPWEIGRARFLASVCEDYHVAPNNMFKIYRPDQVQAALAGMAHFLPLAQPLYVAPPDCV